MTVLAAEYDEDRYTEEEIIQGSEEKQNPPNLRFDFYFSVEHPPPLDTNPAISVFRHGWGDQTSRCEGLCPGMKGRVPLWSFVSHYEGLCPAVKGCVPLWRFVSHYEGLCPAVKGCVQLWRTVSRCEVLCPAEKGCVPLWRVPTVSTISQETSRFEIEVPLWAAISSCFMI